MGFIDKKFPGKLDNIRFLKGFISVLIKRLIEKKQVGLCRFIIVFCTIFKCLTSDS